MGYTKGRRTPSQLNDASLQELALRYVGKYATTGLKLRTYLARKVRERGWNSSTAPDLDSLVQRFAELRYIDDAAYALSKSRSLTERGYGKRRVEDKLRQDGIDLADALPAQSLAEQQKVAAALRYAQRRKIGPFAAAAPDHAQRQKWIGAMIRAGHEFGLARALAALAPGEDVDFGALSDQSNWRNVNPG